MTEPNPLYTPDRPDPETLEHPEILQRFNDLAYRNRTLGDLSDEELRYGVELMHVLRRTASATPKRKKAAPAIDIAATAAQFD